MKTDLNCKFNALAFSLGSEISFPFTFNDGIPLKYFFWCFMNFQKFLLGFYIGWGLHLKTEVVIKYNKDKI